MRVSPAIRSLQARAAATTSAGSGQRRSDCVNDRTGMEKGVGALETTEMISGRPIRKAIAVLGVDVESVEDAQQFLRPMGISRYRLALAIGGSESRIYAIVKGRRTITAENDLRLCRFLGLSDGFWMRMPASHDLKIGRRDLGEVLAAIRLMGVALNQLGCV